MTSAKFLVLTLLAISLTACEGNKDRPGIHPGGVAAAALLTPIILIEGSTGPKPTTTPRSIAFNRLVHQQSRFATPPLNSRYDEAVPLRWLDADRLLLEVKQDAATPSGCTRIGGSIAERQCTLARWTFKDKEWDIDIKLSPEEISTPLSKRHDTIDNNIAAANRSLRHDDDDYAVLQSFGATPVGELVYAKMKSPLGSTGYFVRHGSGWLRLFDAPPAIRVESADISPDMCKMLVRYRGSVSSYNMTIDICGAVKEAQLRKIV